MLWNWFGLGNRNGEPKNRLLFPYWDGRKTRRLCPFVIEDRLEAALGHDWTAVVAKISDPPPPGLMGEMMDEVLGERAKQRKKILEAICSTFEVIPFTDKDVDGKPNGLNTVELYGLLQGYNQLAIQLLIISRPFANGQPRASPSTQPDSAPPNAPGSTSAVGESPLPVPAI